MFRYGVNCALEDVPSRSPVILRGSIEEIARDAAEIGYNGLELFIRNPQQYDGAHLRRVAQEHGLEFCNIATGMEYSKNGLSLISDDLSVRRSAIRRLQEHMDLGKVLGCPVIVGIMRGNIPDFDQYDKYEGYLSEALLELSEYGHKIGVPLVLEAILRYINNYLNTVHETVDYLDRLGCDNILVHIDTHLMNVEDRNPVESILYCEGKLGYVHFSDSNRAYPGGGAVDFKSALGALMDIDYQGYITTECTPNPTPYLCAQRGLEYIKSLERVLQIERAPLYTL